MRFGSHGPCAGTSATSDTSPIPDESGLNERRRASPRTPCAPASSPTASHRSPSQPVSSDRSSGLRPVLFDDVEDNALVLPRGRRGEDRAQRLRRAAFLADDSTEVFLSNSQ